MTAELPLNERQHAILMAALDCFNQSGIEDTSISDIGKLAGASVGSMYHHFGNKEGIAIALLVEGMRSNVLQLERRLKKARDAEHSIKACVLSTVDWIDKNPQWARYIYTVSSSRLMQAGQSQLQPVNDYYAEVIQQYLGPYIEAGAFRTLPQECLASLILGPVHDYARRWLNGQVGVGIKLHGKLFAESAWLLVRQT